MPKKKKKNVKRQRPQRIKKMSTPLAGLVHCCLKRLNDVKVLESFFDEKDQKSDSTRQLVIHDPFTDLKLDTVSAMKANIGTKPVGVTGGYVDTLITTAGNLIQFNTQATAYLNLLPTTTTFGELSTMQLLFDEVKCTGVSIEYEPFAINEQYAGLASINEPFLAVYDNDASSFTPTSSLTGLTTYFGGGTPTTVRMCHAGRAWKHTWHRIGPLSEYPWANFQSMASTDVACRGNVFLAGRGNMTLSKSWGLLFCRLHLLLRIRA